MMILLTEILMEVSILWKVSVSIGIKKITKQHKTKHINEKISMTNKTKKIIYLINPHRPLQIEFN